MRIGPFHFNYHAVEDKKRRAAPRSRVYHESEVLTKERRKKLQATAQDQIRNHSLVAWMVRKHLDYVSKFHVSFRTGKKDVDTLVNRIFKWHGSPRNMDFFGRFGRDEMFRLFELEKVVCGDAGLMKLDDLLLQAVESDLITKGTDAPDEVNSSGLVVDDYGRVQKYCICKRAVNGGTPEYHHLEDKQNIIFDGYWNRFSSQFRGVSPLSTAINTIEDIHEGFEYNLVKSKMHALFGVAMFRNPEGAANLGGAGGATAETEGEKATATQEERDLNPRAINILDMNAGEDLKILESNTPSTQFVEGSYLFIQVAMLALDIPITCFDSRRSSFSARIADLNEYEVSSDSKRTKNRYVRKEYSDWVLSTIWNTPGSPWRLYETASSAGMTLRDVQESLEWIPSGSPWLDKYKQIQGDQLGIMIGIDNAMDACRRRGVDVFDNIDKQAEVEAYAREKGVVLVKSQNMPIAPIEEKDEEEVPVEKTKEGKDE